MAKVRYTLHTGSDHVRTEFIDGQTVLVFEREVHNTDDLRTADDQGDYQSNMLWENFDHSFEVLDDDGNVIEPED